MEVELSEERDEEDDSVRVGAFLVVVEVVEKYDGCEEADWPEAGQSGVF